MGLFDKQPAEESKPVDKRKGIQIRTMWPKPPFGVVDATIESVDDSTGYLTVKRGDETVEVHETLTPNLKIPRKR